MMLTLLLTQRLRHCSCCLRGAYVESPYAISLRKRTRLKVSLTQASYGTTPSTHIRGGFGRCSAVAHALLRPPQNKTTVIFTGCNFSGASYGGKVYGVHLYICHAYFTRCFIIFNFQPLNPKTLQLRCAYGIGGCWKTMTLKYSPYIKQ